MDSPQGQTPPPSQDDNRLDLALRASNEGIWDWWTDRKEIYYSRRILEFLECGDRNPPNIFLPPYDRLHPDDRAEFVAAVESALEAGGPELLAVDCRIHASGGDWRWLRIRGTVVRNRQGSAVRIAGSMIDISRRKAAESQIEDERHLLRTLIDHVPLQIYFKDAESRFLLVNKRMAQWNGGRAPREFIGKHDRDLFASEHWKEAARDEQRIMETGEAITGKLEHEVRDGADDNWVLTSKFPWYDRKGRIKGTFGVSSDVTDLVQAQQRAAALAGELSERNKAYEEEVQLAREIQQAFVSSRVPMVAGARREARFASRYLPITGLAGDFYEIVPIDRQSVGLLICDVMGHGVRSALIVAMLRGLMEKQRKGACDPSAFLRGLNRGLAGILNRAGVSMFATAFYAVIDLDESRLRCACAGHPSAILSGPQGTRLLVTDRDQRGPALGLMPDARYPEVCAPLLDHERLLLYTDGLLEAEDADGEAFMESRLLESVGEHESGSLEELLDGIVDTVLTHARGHHFDDDVCLVAAELAPLSEAAASPAET